MYFKKHISLDSFFHVQMSFNCWGWRDGSVGRALAALLAVLRSVPSNHMVPQTMTMGSDALLWPGGVHGNGILKIHEIQTLIHL